MRSKPSTPNNRIFTALSVVFFIAYAVAMSAAGVQKIAAPQGVTIRSASGQVTEVSVRPPLQFDTVVVDGKQWLRSLVPAGRVRQTADGKLVQIVVSTSIPVYSATSFTTSNIVRKPVQGSLPLLVDRTPSGIPLVTTPPIESGIALNYSGIGRGVHYATLDVVVAETRNGVTSLFESTQVAIQQFASSADNVVLGVKQAETVQRVETLAPVAKITIHSEGVYRLTAQQLRDAGLATDAAAARTVKVYGWGGGELSEQITPALNDTLNEQAIIVNTTADGSISEVLFYANGPTGWRYKDKVVQHYIHHYDRDAHYLITTSGSEGKRCVPRQGAQGVVVNKPLQVQGFVFSEDEMVNPYSSGSGRKWLGRTVENGGSLITTLALPGLIRNSDVVNYRAVVAHRGKVSGTFTVYENATPVMQRVVPSVPEYMDAYSVAASGQLTAFDISSDLRSTLRFEYNCTDRVSTGLIDWVEILYPRGMIADAGSFSFFTTPDLSGVTEYSINGFDGSTVLLFDVTNPEQPEQVQNMGPSGGLAVIRENLDSGVVRHYYVTSSIRNADLSPLPILSLRSRAQSNELAQMIIITHPNLRESAERYAEYRQNQTGVTTSVVTTDEIMNEFGYGSLDPTAIRDFLGYTYRHAPNKPQYVLLWGDGHFDYKGLLSSAPNFIIPYESLDPDDVSYGLSTYTTDDFFVRVEGNDLRPDLAIGRLPITSNAIGDRIREKIAHYENASSTDDWRTKVTLMADDGATDDNKSDGSMHLDQSETLASEHVPTDFQEKKIYLVEYPTDNVARGRRKPGAGNDLVSTVNTSGSLLLNWIGHGNPRVWAHEFAFERETTPQRMTNWDKLFFLTAATCDFARFDLTDVQSGAEELVLSDKGGAIGVFSAARVVFSYANAALNNAFYSQLFTPDSQGRPSALGDVLFTVKQQFTSDNDEKYFLMADPSMRLLIPDYKVVFDSIAGTPLSDTSAIQLQALQTVTIAGHITMPIGNDVANNYNGVATISLLDGERSMQVIDTDVKKTLNSFTLPGALLSKGSFNVVNGRFTASFVIPKDIAFSSSNAKLYGYAISNGNQAARGVTTNVVVDGISNEQHNDSDGPTIAIYMDSRYFVSGQVVRNNPILIVDLKDATGINATGVGIGHNIEADFDQSSMIEVLTETFTTSLEDPKSGTATKQIFGLASGSHTVTVRAWDVLNNTSEATASFVIVPTSDGVVTSWLMNYPNPFSTSTTIRFQHNVNNPFTAQVSIFDTQGRMLVQRDMEIRDMQTAEIVWDGRDSEGFNVGSGIYHCSVKVTESDGRIGMVYGKLVLIR